MNAPAARPRKIFIAIPTQTDAVKLDTMMSIIDAALECGALGWQCVIRGAAGVTPISSARNYLLAHFLASDCTDLVWLDDDVAAEQGALVRLIDQPVDFVLGIYRHRRDPESYPVAYAPEHELLVADPATGLLEIAGAGFGFARMTRTVVERMVSAFEHLAYPEGAAPNGKAWGVFQLDTVEDGIRWSEDMLFCRRWRKLGGKVWCDPEINLMHIGNKGFVGRFGDYLRDRMKAEQSPVEPAAFAA